MAKVYCVMQKIKDDIPGFRDSEINKMNCYPTMKEATEKAKSENALNGGSVSHPGYGAGEGYIVTRYYVEEFDE